jgi:hypothetical protein
MRRRTGSALLAISCVSILALCQGCASPTRSNEGNWTLVLDPGGQSFAGTMSWTKPWQNLVNSGVASNQAARLELFDNRGRRTEERIYRNRLIVQVRKWNDSAELIYRSEMADVGGTNRWRNLEFWPRGQPRMEIFTTEQSNTVMRIGTGRSWYSNGKQEAEYTFRDGLFNGPMRSWDKTGRLAAEGEMRDHKPWQGAFTKWGAPDEGPRKILSYKDGKKVSETDYTPGDGK